MAEAGRADGRVARARGAPTAVPGPRPPQAGAPDDRRRSVRRLRMSDDRGPIYIAGLAHSAKTPLRAALAAHPDISMTRRTYMWGRFYGRFGDLTDERNAERCL